MNSTGHRVSWAPSPMISRMTGPSSGPNSSYSIEMLLALRLAIYPPSAVSYAAEFKDFLAPSSIGRRERHRLDSRPRKSNITQLLEAESKLLRSPRVEENVRTCTYFRFRSGERKNPGLGGG